MQETFVRRVRRTKAQARRSYNHLSRWYDLLAGGSERRFTLLGLEKLRAQEGEKVLELGFGTGQALLALAGSVGAGGVVAGIDIAERMAAIARARLRRAGMLHRVTLSVGDAAALPFCAGSFDAALASFVLELFDTPEIPVVLAECRRVLRADGRMVVVSLAKPSKPGLAVQLYEWVHERLPDYVDCRPILVGKVLADAGFEADETTGLRMWGLPVDIVVARRS